MIYTDPQQVLDNLTGLNFSPKILDFSGKRNRLTGEFRIATHCFVCCISVSVDRNVFQYLLYLRPGGPSC